MKKLLVVVLLIIIILGVIASSFVLNKMDLNKKMNSFTWQAKYIWFDENDPNIDNATPKENDWVCFRKNINIESRKDIRNVIARIAVDSKYWLYINGKIVVREGGVKRGEKRDSIYYDQLDITHYLKKGENTIAILVWHFGIDGFSHIDSKQGALLFQTTIGENTIISDSSWKTILNPAYLKGGYPINNKRLSEPNIYYDASKEIENWYGTEFDDSNWKDATELGDAGNEIWGELIARDIPLFKFAENITEYENFDKYKDYITEEDEVLILETPYNMQLTPYLKIEAQEENQKIYISNSADYAEGEIAQTCVYFTKKGLQEFEMLAWINGEKIYYQIPKGIKILSLGYRKTGYDTEMSGQFVCDDEMFNKLWNMANKTLYINMRDNYMDCPDRERALWFADASVSMEEAMYGLDTKANDLYEKSVKTLLGWREDKLLMTVVPGEEAKMHLPVQMLLSTVSMYKYYEYTGQKEFLIMVYPYLREYLNNWGIKETGLIVNNNTEFLWPWGDSTGICDYEAIENICYYYALNTVKKMAEELEYQEDIKELEVRANNLSNAINKELWTGDGYKEYSEEEYDVRANAFAILSGLADESKYEKITDILKENTNNSTIMEKYILETLCELGKFEEAQNRMKLRYKDMVEGEQTISSTLWEYWDAEEGSKNHAWSGGPLIIMSKYFAGIKPLLPGYEEISVKPNLGNLKNIETKVNAVKGEVNLKVNRNENELELSINVPTKTLIAIEKMNDNPSITVNKKNIYSNGAETNKKKISYQSEDEKYLYFYIEKGKYNFISK